MRQQGEYNRHSCMYKRKRKWIWLSSQSVRDHGSYQCHVAHYRNSAVQREEPSRFSRLHCIAFVCIGYNLWLLLFEVTTKLIPNFVMANNWKVFQKNLMSNI